MTWLRRSQTTSSPGRQCTAMAISLHMVPEGRNSAASMPSSSATRSHSASVVGHSSWRSSPTSASSIDSRIARVGRVCVSE